MTNREKWIDIAKVFGLVIVLMNHIELLLGGVNYYCGMFYVPIFFILAGYTYKYRPEKSFGEFVRRKAVRLLIPYAVYNAVLVLFFTLKDGVNMITFLGALYSRSYIQVEGIEDGTSMSIMTALNGPTWFLTGLFVSLVGFELLMRAVKGDKRKLMYSIPVLILIATLLDLLPVLLPWSLDTLPFCMALLIFGYIVRQDNLFEKTEKKPATVLLWIVLFALVGTWNSLANISIRVYGVSPALFLVTSCLASYLVMLFSRLIERHLKAVTNVLSFVGQHTIGILCLHLFYFMCLGAVLRKVGLSTDAYPVKALMIVTAFVVLSIFDAVVNEIKQRIFERSFR